MKSYLIAIKGHANYPLSERSYTAEGSNFRSATGKTLEKYLADEAAVNPRRKRKIKELIIKVTKA